MSDPSSPTSPLAALRGLRSAPPLDAAGQAELRRELTAALAPCSWFTIGVMAPSAAAAVAALRSCEIALGWPPLREQELAADPAGAVFLKGNQQTGTYLLRPESGLGEGILISGHHEDPTRGDTWGPLPLDLFEKVGA